MTNRFSPKLDETWGLRSVRRSEERVARQGGERRVGNQGAAVAVVVQGEVAGGVLAEQVERCRVGAVAHRQRAATGVARVAERRARAEGDVAQVDAAGHAEAR